MWGIENIRIREQDSYIDLSIKSGDISLPIPVPETLSEATIKEYLTLGDIVIEEEQWTLISGYRRTTFDLPSDLLDELRKTAKEKNLSMSEYVEAALSEKFKREENIE